MCGSTGTWHWQGSLQLRVSQPSWKEARPSASPWGFMRRVITVIRSPCLTPHVAHVPHGCPLYVLGLLKNDLHLLSEKPPCQLASFCDRLYSSATVVSLLTTMSFVNTSAWVSRICSSMTLVVAPQSAKFTSLLHAARYGFAGSRAPKPPLSLSISVTIRSQAASGSNA